MGAPEAAPKTCNRGWHRLHRRPTQATGLRVTPKNFMLQKSLSAKTGTQASAEARSANSHIRATLNCELTPGHRRSEQPCKARTAPPAPAAADGEGAEGALP